MPENSSSARAASAPHKSQWMRCERCRRPRMLLSSCPGCGVHFCAPCLGHHVVLGCGAGSSGCNACGSLEGVGECGSCELFLCARCRPAHRQHCGFGKVQGEPVRAEAPRAAKKGAA